MRAPTAARTGKPSREDAFDAIATALSRHLPIFGGQGYERSLVRMSEADLSMGEFCSGGTRFEFRNEQQTITELAVRKTDLDRLLDAWPGSG